MTNFHSFIFSSLPRQISRAIKSNQDLRPETPIHQLLVDDFWGTPLTHSGSHKSFRPLTVLTFRLNYYFNNLNPYGYHLVNLLIHSAVCVIFAHFTSQLFKKQTIIVIASVLFASHPIHTEAVSSIVGRADCLSGLFFLLSLLSYMKYCKLSSNGKRINGRQKLLLNSGNGTSCLSSNDSICAPKGSKTTLQWRGSIVVIPKKYRNHLFLYLTVAFASCSMLSKETGFSKYTKSCHAMQFPLHISRSINIQ